MRLDPSIKFSQASRFPKEVSKGLAKERQQVAAVCYGMGERGIQFLLVQTRGGRWIFPKGGVEPSLTHAQSAALEAMEEAGVHGRMEEIAFARYFPRKRDTARSPESELAVAVHLCEVTGMESPQEANRNPTWFSGEKAKRRLQQDRAPEFGDELARVIDRAVSRIQRLHARARRSPDRVSRDGLQEVRFEACENGRNPGDLRGAVFARYFLRQRDAVSSATIDAVVRTQLRRVPQAGAPEEIRRPVLRLSAGVGSRADAANNLTAIDGGRTAGSPLGKRPSNEGSGRVVGGRRQKSQQPGVNVKSESQRLRRISS